MMTVDAENKRIDQSEIDFKITNSKVIQTLLYNFIPISIPLILIQQRV